MYTQPAHAPGRSDPNIGHGPRGLGFTDTGKCPQQHTGAGARNDRVITLSQNLRKVQLSGFQLLQKFRAAPPCFGGLIQSGETLLRSKWWYLHSVPFLAHQIYPGAHNNSVNISHGDADATKLLRLVSSVERNSAK